MSRTNHPRTPKLLERVYALRSERDDLAHDLAACRAELARVRAAAGLTPDDGVSLVDRVEQLERAYGR